MLIERAIAACVLAIAGTSIILPERQAGAIELGGGASMGVIVVGTMPRLAITPHATVGWRMESGLLVAVSEVFSILPAGDAHGLLRGVVGTILAGPVLRWRST